ncbi:hypothetical protein [Companilactobacillus sp. HBUAS56275]|uniref:Uncharacterized protein n=1 Tax=Candidatus Companilactobacillus pullicola TaxID=2838523 RepID=A0A9D1ZN70_9LACO|nr:hypothetical protein [Candidatus Companilactobacillus pullicola]
MKEADSMNGKFIGILAILIGIWQIAVAQKMYQDIRRNVKQPKMTIFFGVTVCLIIGVIFLMVGGSLLR